MRKNFSILVAGSINMDMIVHVPRFPNQGETITGSNFSTANGGKGANQAVAAARLGTHVFFVGCVGGDDFGKQSILSLQNEGVETNNIQTALQVNTGVAVINVNEQAQNQIIVIPGANHAIQIDHIEHVFQNTKKKVDGMLLQLEIPMDAVIRAAELGKEHKTLVILNPAPAIPIPNHLIRLVDYIIPNEHEVYVLTGEKNPETAGKKLIAQGAKHVIITLGDKGALYINEKVQYVKPYKVVAKDPTAAGDAFVAGFSVALLEGKSPIDAIKFGNATGALAASKIGAQPSLPTRQEIERFIAN